jgi:predicted site-specific integrase-resolvase
MQVSISEASRRFVVSRNTIYEHGKDGLITIHTDDQGKKRVDVADLHRLYEPRQQAMSSVVQDGHAVATG